MNFQSPRSFRPLRKSLLLALLVVAPSWGLGCGSLKSWKTADKVRGDLDRDRNNSIAGMAGPAERSLSARQRDQQREAMARGGDESTRRDLAALDSARALYGQGEYAKAEKQFHKLAKERRARYETTGIRWRRAWGLEDECPYTKYGNYGDPLGIEEEAIFLTAECQYQQRQYAAAEVTYQDLIKRYPSTRYMDGATRQLFRIASYWLDFPQQLDENGNPLPDSTVAPGTPASALDRVAVMPNLTDKSRPLFDSYGRGKNALKTIWLHDSTSPLAPDSIMLAANHATRVDDYVEARRLYKMLREEYPDSIHLKDAYVMGAYVTQASYQGAAYEGATLSEARQLKSELLAVFPNLTDEERSRLIDDVEVLKEEEVARLWEQVELFHSKRDYPATMLHCYMVINQHPDSSYAERARKLLAEVQQSQKKWENSSLNFNKARSRENAYSPHRTMPQRIQPVPANSNTQPRSSQVPADQSSPPPATSRLPSSENAVPVPPAEMPKPGLFERLNPLRKTEKPPELKTPPVQEQPNNVNDGTANEFAGSSRLP